MGSRWTDRSEWLEADGLGGFASGTVGGLRTRRHHALLLTATAPPTARFVLLNGFDAWLETDAGTFNLSAQRYTPDVLAPDVARRQIEAFSTEPWPRWRFRLPDGTCVSQEIFVPHGASAVVCAWKLETPLPHARLYVRLFLSGRPDDALHRANDSFRGEGIVDGECVTWRTYDKVPGLVVQSNGRYERGFNWYYNFLYEEDHARGMDCTEDLAAPGIFTFDLSHGDAVLLAATDRYVTHVSRPGRPTVESVDALRSAERERRAAFASRLHRSADVYIVRHNEARTIIAGYPWHSDRGRETFIAMRGLCLSSGRLDVAREILLAWAERVSGGMLPDRLTHPGEPQSFSQVDTSLWFVVAVHDWLGSMKAARVAVDARVEEALLEAVQAILLGYAHGTRLEIRMDHDGLIAAGVQDVPLTWMDAKAGDWVVTPRRGKAVEVQALWLNALQFGRTFDRSWERKLQKSGAAFVKRFWNDALGCLYDLVDVDGRPGAVDESLRPNQILAVGGLPYRVLPDAQSAAVVGRVEQHLWTPLGLRTLAPESPGFVGRYQGAALTRDAAAHQGTVWPWLIGPFVEAWMRVNSGRAAARSEARERFMRPLLDHLNLAGLDHLSELADGVAPHTPRGCPFSACSMGELLRLELDVLQAAPGGRLSQAIAAASAS